MAAITAPASYGPVNGALSDRLHEPETVAALVRLIDRADDIARAADTLTRVAERMPRALAMVTDVVDDACRTAAASGVDVDERMRLAAHLAERLTAPRTVAALTALLDRVDLVERAVQMADRVPGFVAMAVDGADEVLRQSTDSGVDVAAGLTRVITGVGSALAAASTEEPPRVGLLGMLRALRQPDIRRAIGFLLRFAAHFGRSIAPPARAAESSPSPAR